MRALILGAGRMGEAAAWDLARQEDVESITVVDQNAQRLSNVSERVSRGAGCRILSRYMDLSGGDGLEALLKDHDVALSAADYDLHLPLTRAAIAQGVSMCDLGGNNSIVAQQLGLDAEAAQAGVTIVPDCGLAPGLANWLTAHAVEQLWEARREAVDTSPALSARIYVGGLPAHPAGPLQYKLVFSVRGLINEYIEPTQVLRHGKLLTLPSLTEPEPVDFPEPFGQLEAFHTSGGASTLVHTLAERVANLEYKTLRYPGHLQVISAMNQLGFFSEAPVGGTIPRKLSEQLLEQALSNDDTDVVLLRVVVEDKEHRRGVELEMIDRHDTETGHSAMARTTAYPTAAVMHMLAQGHARRAGVLPCEQAFDLATLITEVRNRGLTIQERRW